MLDPRGTVPQVQVVNHEAIGFMGALRIPGVIEFSLCLFFSKLVSYTFLFWLPMYIQSSSKYKFQVWLLIFARSNTIFVNICNTRSATLGAALSADLSTLFDVGGIVGAIAAGVISDYTGMSACTCTGMLIFAVPMVILLRLHFSIE